MKQKIIRTVIHSLLIVGVVFGLLRVVEAHVSNINTGYAWGTNVGWLNFGSVESGGLTVYPDHLEGYVWGENVGWIRVGTHTGGGTHSYGNTSQSDYGVNRDCATNQLSGYAWGTNVGWINFNPTDGGVTVNPETGKFDGYAWGENIGWIDFQNGGSNPYHVEFVTNTLTIESSTPHSYSVGCGTSLVTVNVTDTGSCLTGLTINRTASNPPDAPEHIQDGQYWSITPTGCTTGFAVDLTLPHTSNITADKARACRYDTGSSSWDCDEAGDHTTSDGAYVTRTGVTEFEIWAVGDASPPEPPTAAFSASPPTGTAPLNVTFTDQSSGGVTSWTWDFGDGYVSGARYPAHQYTLPGSYTVSLTVSGPGGEDSETKEAYITVNEPTEVNTLILTNRQKVAALHGEASATQLMGKLGELAAHERVKGLVIPVENEPSVATAYAAWDADPTSTEKANAVTSAIKGMIDAKLASYPDVEYIVVAGDDRVIPFRRVRDKTWYSERRYRYNVSCDSVTGAALCNDMTLTDDYYADRVAFVPKSRGWDGQETYLPDFGIGRLIETPQEMMAQIDTFLGDDGIAVSKAVVTGYSFVTDAAAKSYRALDDAGVTTNTTLIGKNWSKDDFIREVLKDQHDLVSINGHANHYRIGTPNGVVTSEDIAGASEIHQRAVFYTIACHSGLNVPPENQNPLDTAQAFVQKQANYVGNTGYGYGYRYSVGLSEQLMIDFTKQLTHNGPTTLGQALTAAKQKYYLRSYDFGYYDEKILIESTLYGLPMYDVTSGSSQRAATSEAAPDELPDGVIVKETPIPLDGEFSKTKITFGLPELTKVVTDTGTYYSLDGLIHSEHGEPIQPKLPFAVSVPGTNAHGLVFKGGTYSDINNFDPVIAEAVTLTLPSAAPVLAEPPFTTTNWYPAIPSQLNILDNGTQAQMTALLGQYNSSIEGGSERLYSELSVDVYYHGDSDDWTAPTIASVNSELATDTATVTVATSDDSGIHEVLVTYSDNNQNNQNGAWQSVVLTDTGDAWSGTFPATANTPFFVQVVDKAGNVTVDDNNGAYYKFDVNNAVLVGEVDLQGRPGKPDPRWNVPLRVSLTVAGDSTPAYELTPTTDQNGMFTVEGIEPGSYELRVKHSHTLQKMVNVTLVEGDNNIDVGTLLEGDANDDNFVTLLDFSILANAFGTCEGASNYDGRADFNYDGCVTLLDFSLLANNFGQGGQALHLSEPTWSGLATNGLAIRVLSTIWPM